MARRKNRKNKRKYNKKFRNSEGFILPRETMRWIYGVLMFLATAIIVLAFFEKAGVAGRVFVDALSFLFGKAVFITPLVLVLSGLAFLLASYRNIFWPVVLADLLLLSGLCGILSALNSEAQLGGWLGQLISTPLLKFFEFWVTRIIFTALIFIGGLIFFQLLTSAHIFSKEREAEEIPKELLGEDEKPLFARILKRVVGAPKFKVKELESSPDLFKEKAEKISTGAAEVKTRALKGFPFFAFEPPPFDLLEADKESPNSGDIRLNSAIIKKTLENFDIPVEMSEVNIGPAVTQYTLKPAEGVKLSKITSLSSDLALALASHPLRIEAPIPGRSLVGVEVPNKVRARVRLRNLLENSLFRDSKISESILKIALGRDVAGGATYADLAKMPHFLVAGSTGTGKTIFLNSLILSLLYQNSPKTLRFILIDPKRVEFSVYADLPHLLCPVILDAGRAINSLKWTTGEMERRFDMLSGIGARNLASYNEKATPQNLEILPYIVLIIDELADLMAARGREMEAGIVRLAQMARAVGIHLVVATQRPSVEVITGLIKANITSRITFQVASQVDSRTVIDTGGAEKLLGLGDMLYISAEAAKPKRIQAAYVSEKEVKKVVDYIEDNTPKIFGEESIEGVLENGVGNRLKKALETQEGISKEFVDIEDPLYEEAKRMVIEARKASASLLQRRLRIGYARAARLIDILEERGVVGPGEGARPREVYAKNENVDNITEENNIQEEN